MKTDFYSLPELKIWFAMLLFGWSMAGAVQAGETGSLDKWRGEITAVRTLAENNAPQSYLEAQLLHKDIPAGAVPADRTRILNLLARIELYLGMIGKSSQHSAQARAIAKQNNDRVGQIEADIVISLSAINQGRLEDMIEATRDGMDLLVSSEREDLRAEVMFHAAMMYLRFGHFDEAVTVAMQSLDIAKNSENPLALAYAEHGMAVSYLQSGLYAEAREHYQYMQEAARQAHSTLLEAGAQLGLSGIAAHQGDAAEGERLCLEAIALFRRVGGPFYVSHALFQLADLRLKNNQPARALPLLDEDVAIYEQHTNPIGLWWTLNERSTALQALGRLDAARSDAERANGLAQKIGFTVYLAGSARRLADVAAAQGEFQQAYRLSAQATELNSKLERENSSKRILDLSKQFQQESKQRQIDDLTRRNRMQAAEQRWLWAILGGSAAMLYGTVYFLLRLRRKQNEIRALNAGLEQRVMERTVELLESRQSLSEAQRIAQVGSWENNLVDNILTWSDEVYRIFEIDPQQFGASYEAFMESVHPDDREVLNSTFKASLENREPFEIEHRLLLPDGRIKYVHEHCETKYDTEGRPLRSIGTVQDITERKEIENALHESRQLLTEAQRIAHVGSWDLDHVSNILTWSDESQRIFEIDSQQVSVTYEVFLDTIHPEDRDTVNRIFLASLENHSPYEIVHRLSFPDGRIKYVHEHCETTYDADGKPLRSIGTTQDITERKEMENALRESRQLLTEAQRIAHVGSWEYDIASDTHTWSDELFRIYEIDPVKEGASYEGCLNATHPDDRDAITRAYLNSVETGQPYESEHRLLMADGRIKHVHERCETICGADGTLLRAVGMMQDITERKQAEQKLKEALEFSQGIINAIPDILFEMDRDGRYLNVWTQNPELLAAQKQALLGKTVHEVLSPENADAAMEAIRETEEKGISLGKDICIELPHGKFWFAHSLAKKPGSKPSDATFLVWSRDITERKRMEEELLRRERMFRTLAENSPDNIIRYDRDCRIIYINPNTENVFGQTLADASGKTSSTAILDGRYDEIEATVRRVIASGEPADYYLSSTDGEGGTRQHHLRITPERDELGQVYGVLAIGRDVTALKRLEAAREAALTEAKRLAGLRSEFIAHMSHELRTPLNAILGYAQMLCMSGGLDGKQREGMEVILQSGEHLLALIDDILDLARIESGKFWLDVSDIPLARFLHFVAGAIGIRARQKHLEFACELAPDLPQGVRGDEKRLRQVLLNLLSNAVKYTDSGKVTLHVCRAGQSRLTFIVEDSGIGIGEAARETIFLPFEQAGDAQHRTGGSGLGLSISRQLVRLMGGEIEIESRAGGGSIFRFELELPEIRMEPDALPAVPDDMRPAAQEAADESGGALIIPPQKEMQELRRLALLGNMRDLAAHAERIGNLDPRYRPFAEHLKNLTETFQSKTILALAQEYLP